MGILPGDYRFNEDCFTAYLITKQVGILFNPRVRKRRNIFFVYLNKTRQSSQISLIINLSISLLMPRYKNSLISSRTNNQSYFKY